MAPNGSQAEGSSDGAGGLSWKGFLDGGSKGVKEAVVLDEGRRVKLCWVDGHESEFSLVWLRDNSDGSFHPTTKQREVRCLLCAREDETEILQHVHVENRGNISCRLADNERPNATFGFGSTAYFLRLTVCDDIVRAGIPN